jgi:hypothetical protein
MKGPASLEIKEDEVGHQYVIEPTVGRFDYYILCCIVNGVDMPYISYMYQAGNSIRAAERKKRRIIWVDFEMDFPMYIESFSKRGERWEAIKFLARKKAFAMWAWDDMKPSLSAWPKGMTSYFRKCCNKIRKLFLQRKEVS